MEVGKKKENAVRKVYMEASVVPALFTLTYLVRERDSPPNDTVVYDRVLGGILCTAVVACVGEFFSKTLAYTMVGIPLFFFVFGKLYQVARRPRVRLLRRN